MKLSQTLVSILFVITSTSPSMIRIGPHSPHSPDEMLLATPELVTQTLDLLNVVEQRSATPFSKHDQQKFASLKQQLGSLPSSFCINHEEHYNGEHYQPVIPHYVQKLEQMFPGLLNHQSLKTQPQLPDQALSWLQETNPNIYHTARYQVIQSRIKQINSDIQTLHEERAKLYDEQKQYSVRVNLRGSGLRNSSFDLKATRIMYQPTKPLSSKAKTNPCPRLLKSWRLSMRRSTMNATKSRSFYVHGNDQSVKVYKHDTMT